MISSNFKFLVDCKWSEFGEWTDCSKICGGGTRTSIREISQPALYGGANCTGESRKSENCNTQVCEGT